MQKLPKQVKRTGDQVAPWQTQGGHWYSAGELLAEAEFDSNPLRVRVDSAFGAGFHFLLATLKTRTELPADCPPSRNVLGLAVCELGIKPSVLSTAARYIDFQECEGAVDDLLPDLLAWAYQMRRLAQRSGVVQQGARHGKRVHAEVAV